MRGPEKWKVVEHWNRIPSEVVEIFKTKPELLMTFEQRGWTRPTLQRPLLTSESSVK